MQTVVYIVDIVLFLLLGIPVLYLFIYALFSTRRREYVFPQAQKQHRFITLIPAYKGDEVIEETVKAALKQCYPSELHRVVVIADRLRKETLDRLEKLNVEVLIVNFENSSKAKALNYAIEHLGPSAADMVTVLDVDNIVDENFIDSLNNVYDSGVQAIQTHRKAKNRDTHTAVLDAASEEINNSIFRRGHIALGVSSALVGSGMAFDYKWFAENITKCSSAGEDKELEMLLLKQGVFIDYLDEVIVLDEKVQKEGSFYNQRRRWIAAQFNSLMCGLRDLPSAVISGNIDYCDKLIQWMMPPRIILLGLVPIAAIAATIIIPEESIKWWIVVLMLLFALAWALPDDQMDNKLKSAIRRVPILFILMLANMFRLRGANKKFIHTQHQNAENEDCN